MTSTWEGAAANVIDHFLDRYRGLRLNPEYDTRPDEIEALVDRLAGKDNEWRDVSQSDAFAYIFDDALQSYDGAEDRAGAEATVLHTIISKQHDYGHDNILWGGVEGIVLRIHDKVARIRNLQGRLDAEQARIERTQDVVINGGERVIAPLNESLADSWLDIAGYAVIGIMLLNGTFELPLARDLAAVEPEYIAGVPLGTTNALDDAYDELTDPELWHLETKSQDVFVGTYLDGFDDGVPHVGIFTRGKNERGALDARGAYFTIEQLSELLNYLDDALAAMATHEELQGYLNRVVVAA